MSKIASFCLFLFEFLKKIFSLDKQKIKKNSLLTLTLLNNVHKKVNLSDYKYRLIQTKDQKYDSIRFFTYLFDSYRINNACNFQIFIKTKYFIFNIILSLLFLIYLPVLFFLGIQFQLIICASIHKLYFFL